MNSLPDASFAVYFATDDAVIECGANDPDFGPADAWPRWTDADHWEPTDEPRPPATAPVMPSEADSAWYLAELAPISGGSPEAFEPTDQDYDDMYQAAYGGFSDDDLTAAGLPCG